MAAVDNYPVWHWMICPYFRAYDLDALKSDAEELPEVTRGIMCRVAGNIKVVMRDSADPVIIPVLAGVEYKLRVRKIFSTLTTATGLVGLA